MNESIQKLKDLINLLNYNLRTHSQDLLPTLKEILSELEGKQEVITEQPKKEVITKEAEKIEVEPNEEVKDVVETDYERAMEFMKQSWSKWFYNTKPENLIKKAIDMWFIL